MARLLSAAPFSFARRPAGVLGAYGQGKRVAGGSVLGKKSKKRFPTRPSH